jgi:sugar phosphate isomerase/epimerase
MSRIPIALQLYSIREDCQEDFPGTLQAVAEMGYEGVDFAGYYGYEAEEIRTILDDLGLKVAGCHTALDTLTGDARKRTIAFNHTLGNAYLIVPGLPERYRASKEAWLRTADLFNEIADALEPEGMMTGYHNHFIEFEPMEGAVPWDLFFGSTKPEVVMQIDTGNALHGGGDPVAILKQYPGRAKTVHLKEYAEDDETALIGEGDVDWEGVFAVVESQGATDWYIVEQESYAYPPLACVDRCLQALKAMGK